MNNEEWNKEFYNFWVEKKLCFANTKNFVDLMNDEFERMGILYKKRTDEEIQKAFDNVKKQYETPYSRNR